MKRSVIDLGKDRVTVYEAKGSGDLTVLFVHGVGGTGKVWARQLRDLRSYGRMLAVDLPGFSGGSLPADIVSLSDWVPFLLRLLDALGVSSAVWVGNSLGGRIALETALTAPARVEGLGLLCSAGVSLASLPLEPLHQWATTEFERRLFYRPERFTALQTEAGRRQGEAERALYERLVARTERMDFSARLAEIQVPTRVIWGQHDGVIPLPHGELLAKGIPGASWKVLAESAHVPQLEQPGAVVEELRALLEAVAERKRGCPAN